MRAGHASTFMVDVNGAPVVWTIKARVLFAVALAAVAASLVLWFRPHAAANGMQAVVAASAALDYRPSLARLSGDFPYRDVKPRLRGSNVADISPASAALWAVIERVRQDVGGSHELGVSYLLVGRPKDAMATLEQTLRYATNQHGDLAEAIRRSRDAALLNDLAATYLSLDDAALRPLALEAVQRAWAIDRTPAIAWTRAVVIDSYHIRERSIAGWRDYLALEPRSQWSESAHQRLNDLLQPTDAEAWPAVRKRLAAARDDDPALFRDVDHFRQEVRLWCENELLPKWGDAVLRDDPSAASQLAKIAALGGALEKASGEREIAGAVEAIRKSRGDALRQLAKGHVAYGAGLLAEKQTTVQEATDDLATAAAALDPQVTPFAWRARMEHAGMLYSSNQYRQALAELQQLEKESDTRISGAGQARLQTLLAVAFMNNTSYKEAVDHYVRAVGVYQSIGERDYESALLIRIGEALNLMGDKAGARRYLQHGREIQERTGDPKHGHYAMIMSAIHALGENQQAESAFFLDALVEIDGAAGDISRICTSTMWRSAYRYRIGLAGPAESDLAVAQRVCGSIPDRAVRERQLAYLEAAKGFGANDPSSEPLTDLDEAIRYFDRSNNRIWLSTAYFARARRLARRGEAVAAERDFQAAIRETDANREKIDERLLRASFTATADEITDGYVDFLLQQRRERDAFETSDRRRVRELVDSPTARWRSKVSNESLLDIQAALGNGTAMVEYRVLRDRIVAWVVTRQRFETITLPSAVSNVTAAVADGQSNASVLYDELVRPIEPAIGDARALIIVPDDELERVAFSALRDSTRGRSLLETYATAIAPSAALFVRSRARLLERSTRVEQVVVVKAAAGDAGIAALPEADREAMSIAFLYRGARIVDGSAATGISLLNELRDATVLQFAGHTVMDADPVSRTLRLGETQQARLGMADIAGAAMPRMRLVYLSACDTDRGPVLKSEGSITIARSFFAAGVPVVVGTLWPIEDSAAHLAARTFHERLLRGDTPAESLRQAQLALLHQGVPFRDWASLRLIGAGF
jgi:CHAT domain-containing protein/tetratricopeptide (TPR) repeat protein